MTNKFWNFAIGALELMILLALGIVYLEAVGWSVIFLLKLIGFHLAYNLGNQILIGFAVIIIVNPLKITINK